MSRVLVLYNQVDADGYEALRAEGPRTVAWDAAQPMAHVNTIAEEYQTIINSLIELGHTPVLFNICDNVQRLLDGVRDARPDVIFNFVEFFGNDLANEMYIAGLLELLGVPYTGNRPEVLALCQQKHRAKAVLAASGVPTARYFVVAPGEAVPPHSLCFPLIVKPAMEDASGGIDKHSIVHDAAALTARVASVTRDFQMPVIVEEFIAGREIHCAILGDEALPLFEMEFFDHRDDQGNPLPKIITYQAKWDPESRDYYAMDGRCPPVDLEPEIQRALCDVGLAAYRAVGARDYARVDMRIDADGSPYVLEVNPNPDLSDECAFVQCASVAGLSYTQMIGRLIDCALARRSAPPTAATAPIANRKTGT